MKNKKDRILINKKVRDFDKKIKEVLERNNLNKRKIPPIQEKKVVKPAEKKVIRRVRKYIPGVVETNRKEIFITGGIGDVIALESFFSSVFRENLNTIYYGTNKQQPIQSLFETIPNYPNLINHVVVWKDFSNFWCFFGKEDYLHKATREKIHIPYGVYNAEDFSISRKFHDLNIKSYNNSSFILFELANIDKFSLPQDYVCICPYSTDKRTRIRDFNHLDWKGTLNYLKRNELKGVILNIGNDRIPEDKHLINLNNQTTLIESIEILKKSKGYIGVDSSLSVLATKLFSDSDIFIKSNNQHLYRWKHVYYAPKTNFNFIRESFQNI